MVEILQFVHEISSFPEVLCKGGDLKNFSKFTDKHKKQSSGGVLSKRVLKILQNSQINIFAGVYFFIKLQGGNLKLSEAANGGILSKKVLFKRRTGISERAVHRSSWIIHKIHRKKPVLESLFNKVAFLRACNFSKEDSDTCAFPWNLQTF